MPCILSHTYRNIRVNRRCTRCTIQSRNCWALSRTSRRGKTITTRSSDLSVICYYNRNYCVLKNLKLLYVQVALSSFHFLGKICQIQQASRAINAREKERPIGESDSSMLDNLQDFLSLPPHCLLPRRRFFVLVIIRVIRRAAAPIISAAERTLRGRQ